MKIGKLILLIILAVIMVGGCSGKEKMSATARTSGDYLFRKAKDFCEQEAEGRCWKPADSSPLWLNEIWENYKQSKCKKEWISTCMEKQGYGEQQ